MNKRQIKDRVNSIQQRYEALEAEFRSLIRQVIGDYCLEKGCVFSYFSDVMFYVPVASDDVDDDSCLRTNAEICCYRFCREWRYCVTPPAEVVDLLGDYEDLFGNLPLCECRKGEWHGL